MLFNFANGIQDFFDGIAGLEPTPYEMGEIFTDDSFPRYSSKYVYKFVTEDTYKQHVAKGSFLLSSLSRYREMEMQGSAAGDRFEGACFSSHTVGGRQITFTTLSGFDSLFFSAASDLENAAYMASTFGPIILRIDLHSFAGAMARAIGSPYPGIRLVRYADLKLFRSTLLPEQIEGFPRQLTPTLARALRGSVFRPSVFGKPKRFAPEREVRLSFPMGRDVQELMSISAPALLGSVERLN